MHVLKLGLAAAMLVSLAGTGFAQTPAAKSGCAHTVAQQAECDGGGPRQMAKGESGGPSRTDEGDGGIPHQDS